jgi:uncharacterized membrane protein
VRDPLDLPARPETIAALGLSGEALDRALDLAGEGPDRRAWASVLDRTLLVAGALLVLSGVVCFFAWNWADLHRFAKMGIVAAGVAGTGAAALRTDLDRLPGKVLASAAAALTGVLLAVYGQAYQTGADAWELFRAWAVLALPFALAARFPALWAFWMAVVNAAVLLWAHAAGLDEEPAAWLAVGVNGAAWAAWEALAFRVEWMRDRSVPRLLSLPTLGVLAVAACVWAVDRTGPSGLFPLALAVLCAAAVALFVLVRRDLFLVAVALAAAIAFATTWVGERLDRVAGDGGIVLTALFLVAEIAGVVRWLTVLHRRSP